MNSKAGSRSPDHDPEMPEGISITREEPPYTTEMDSPDRNARFNKQSSKVNAGLDFGSATFEGQDVGSAVTYDGLDVGSAFASNVPPISIDFGAFVIPPRQAQNVGSTIAHNASNFPSASNVPPTNIDFGAFVIPPRQQTEEQLQTPEIVRRLLKPPPHAFVYGVLSISWVIGVAGPKHFEYREEDGRSILTQTSELRKNGKALGLLAVLYEWLCGDNLENSAIEDGMLLTMKFFENEI